MSKHSYLRRRALSQKSKRSSVWSTATIDSPWTNSRPLREEMIVGQGCSVLHFLASASPRLRVLSTAPIELSHLLDFALKSGAPPDPVMSTVDSNGRTLALTPLAITCLGDSTSSISARLLMQAGANRNHNVSRAYPSIMTFLISETPDGFAHDCLEVMLRHHATIDERHDKSSFDLGKAEIRLPATQLCPTYRPESYHSKARLAPGLARRKAIPLPGLPLHVARPRRRSGLPSGLRLCPGPVRRHAAHARRTCMLRRLRKGVT